jgi:hypothetical protein
MPPQADSRSTAAPAEMTLAMLAIAHPGFRVTMQARRYWRSPRFEAVRRNGAEPGLYAVITSDADELHAALTADAARTRFAEPAPPLRGAQEAL